jgi:hypothetical protein
MYKRTQALAAATLLLASARSATAAVTITDDPGGRIGTYIQKFEALRQSGERVIVSGTCSSACTMLLGIVPRSRICVTPSAVFQFHTAWDLSPTGQQIVSEAGNRVLWSKYPADVRNWITQHGGLGQGIMSLSGPALARIVPACR